MVKVLRNSIADLEPSLENLLVQLYDSQLNDEQVDTWYRFYSTPIAPRLRKSNTLYSLPLGCKLEHGGRQYGLQKLLRDYNLTTS